MQRASSHLACCRIRHLLVCSVQPSYGIYLNATAYACISRFFAVRLACRLHRNKSKPGDSSHRPPDSARYLLQNILSCCPQSKVLLQPECTTSVELPAHTSQRCAVRRTKLLGCSRYSALTVPKKPARPRWAPSCQRIPQLGVDAVSAYCSFAGCLPVRQAER